MTNANDTLAEVVVSNTARARVLDRLGLDYCCGGDETLDHACVRAGLDIAGVVAQLDATPSAGDSHDCASMTPRELIAHLVEVHHSYLHAELPDLDRLARKVFDVHGERHSELCEVQAIVAALRDDLEPHLRKEEEVLFPALVELLAGPGQFPFGSIANPITMMTTEHDRVGGMLAHLRALTDDYAVPGDGCASYRSLYDRLAGLEHDTHLHVFEENHLLFPQALALEDTGAET
jgi:regulator of cell morphogenesis and NO signaling